MLTIEEVLISCIESIDSTERFYNNEIPFDQVIHPEALTPLQILTLSAEDRQIYCQAHQMNETIFQIADAFINDGED